MIHIIGEHIKEMQAFNDVRMALDGKFDVDVYLGAFMARRLGIELSGKVIYNMEYLHDDNPMMKLGYMDTLRENAVIDFSRSNVDYLKRHGIEAFYMPYGFHDGLCRVKSTEKDIDILFIGSIHHKRRIDVLKKLDDVCELSVAVGVYGDELDKLVARSKVHLNMHHAEGQPLETVRLNYLLANGCNVVSERGSDVALNEQYSSALHFCDYENIVESCISAINEHKSSKETIESMPMNCELANEWAKEKVSCRLYM